jgi:hypothetical protein
MSHRLTFAERGHDDEVSAPVRLMQNEHAAAMWCYKVKVAMESA